MTAELPKSERQRLMAELDQFFPETKHTEREMHLLSKCTDLESALATEKAAREVAERDKQALTEEIARSGHALLDQGQKLRDERAAHERTRAELERVKEEHRNCTAYVGWQDALKAKEAVESALASARKQLWRSAMTLESLYVMNSQDAGQVVCASGPEEVAAEIQAWLSTAPTPAPSEPIKCTGFAASWCPKYGDCECPRLDTGEREEESDECPLHGSKPGHAEEPPSEPVAVTEARILIICSSFAHRADCKRLVDMRTAWLSAHSKPADTKH